MLYYQRSLRENPLNRGQVRAMTRIIAIIGAKCTFDSSAVVFSAPTSRHSSPIEKRNDLACDFTDPENPSTLTLFRDFYASLERDQSEPILALVAQHEIADLKSPERNGIVRRTREPCTRRGATWNNSRPVSAYRGTRMRNDSEFTAAARSDRIRVLSAAIS